MSDTTETTKPKRSTSAAKKAAVSAAETPAAKKPAAKTAAKSPAKSASKTTTKAKTGTKTTRTRKATSAAVTAEERYRMIAEAAYYIAESNGFDNARNMEYWLEAEAQVDKGLSGGTEH